MEAKSLLFGMVRSIGWTCFVSLSGRTSLLPTEGSPAMNRSKDKKPRVDVASPTRDGFRGSLPS